MKHKACLTEACDHGRYLICSPDDYHFQVNFSKDGELLTFKVYLIN